MGSCVRHRSFASFLWPCLADASERIHPRHRTRVLPCFNTISPLFSQRALSVLQWPLSLEDNRECFRPHAIFTLWKGDSPHWERSNLTQGQTFATELDMAESPQTQGEILFEEYLKEQNLPFEFEKEYPGKSKRPDYTIEWNGKAVIFEVKDIDPLEKFPAGFGYFDPYTRIREKIEQGRDKFKQYKEFCCGLVLHNAGQPFVSLHDPDIMLGAMYGDSGFTFPVDTRTGKGDASQLKRAFLARGKMIRPKWSAPQNTTI